MERSGGFDKEAFDNLLKQILENAERSAERPEEQPGAASKTLQAEEPPPPATESAPHEIERVIEPPAAPPPIPPQEAPAQRSADQPAESAVPEQGVAESELEALKKRLADLEATQSRLQEQLLQSAEQLAAAQKESAPPTEEAVPSPQPAPAAPEAEAIDQPVAAERALVKVPDVGELSRPAGPGFLDRLLSLLHRLFPSFVPSAETALPPDNPDALYAGHIELVISAEEAWGRLERILTGLSSLRGTQVHGLYSGPRGEQTVSLEIETPASLRDIQAAVPELKEIRTLSSRKGVTRLAVKIT